MSDIEQTRVMGPGSPGQDRTQVMPGGGQATMVMPAPGDASRTQMGGTTTCPVCKSTTSLMDPFCGDCGFLLASPPAAVVELPVDEAPIGELVDSQSGRRFRLREGVNTVGRQGTDILVDEGTVSRNHARITISGGSATVEDLGSSNGTKVGDLRLSANQPVQAPSGTPLRFGNWNVKIELAGFSIDPSSATIVMPAGESDEKPAGSGAFVSEDTFIATALVAPTPPEPPAAGVESVAGGAMVGSLRNIEGGGDDVAVTEGVISIGRRPENTVVLTGDAYISGKHAEIVTDSTGTYLTDLGSTNGTVVNGARVTANERMLLSDGDEVHIGQSKYRFEVASDVPAELDDLVDGLPSTTSGDA